MITDFEVASLADLLRSNPRFLPVLHRYGIPYLEHLEQPLTEVCIALSLNPQQLIVQFQSLSTEWTAITPPDFAKASAEDIVFYLQKTHLSYICVLLPIVKYHLVAITKTLGDKYPVLHPLREAFDVFEEDFKSHIDFEEKRIFPQVKNLAAAVQGNYQALIDYSIHQKSVVDLLGNHPENEKEMEDLANLTREFYSDPTDPFSYQLLMWTLRNLQLELQQHGHIETHVLLPKVKLLEQGMRRRIRYLSVSN